MGVAAVFWFRIPIALIAIALVVTWVPVRTVATQEERFDLPGAIGLALAMTTGLLALTRGAHFGWLSAPTVGLLGIGIVAGTWFANRQGKVEHPVIDISLFRQRRFVAANSAHVMVNAASFLVLLLVPYYLAQAMRVHGSVAGMILAISPIGLMVASAVAGRLIPRLGAWALGLGAIGIVAAGLAGIAALPSSPLLGLLGAVLFIHGFGHGLFQVAILDLVMATIPPAHHGVAGSLNMMTRTIGVVVGASGGVLIFGRLGGSTQSPANQAFLDAFNGTFWAACAVVVAAGVLVVLATPQSRQ